LNIELVFISPDVGFPQNGLKAGGGSRIGAQARAKVYDTTARRRSVNQEYTMAMIGGPWPLNSESPPAFPIVGLESGSRNRHKSERDVASNSETGIRSTIE
jgi:hypothetical protein